MPNTKPPTATGGGGGWRDTRVSDIQERYRGYHFKLDDMHNVILNNA